MRLDIESRWPDLFVRLDASARSDVLQSLSSAWRQGWVPNREDVQNLTDRTRGTIDHDEYMRLLDEPARRWREPDATHSWASGPSWEDA